ncbi:MAG TPA: glutamate--cysteine ligase [Nocardioides sp.]|nr:glutamate--cysteine ligase [Nocardioides sp.]
MDPRTVGVEEELLLVDPETRRGSPHSQQVLKHWQEHHSDEDAEPLDHELFRHQIETRTPPLTDLAELHRALVRSRQAVAESAGAVGIAAMAAGTLPLPGPAPQTTRDDRYLDMIDRYGEIARPGGTCGMHVHVAIDSEEEGVEVIDDLATWLPVVLAVSANSPFFHGRDTSYASWRSQIWAQWPSAGPTEPFGSLEGYRTVSRRLIASGAARDEGMLYFDARLARDYPTVEVRISDVCTDPDDAVLIAAIVRGLVTRDRQACPPADRALWRTELVRAAQWRAARYGLGDRLLDPITAEVAPARAVLEHLVDTIREQLEATGDLDLVEEGTRRVLAEGGSVRQRAAYERSGGSLSAVVDDLVRRTSHAHHG